eukprot:gnl/MRDRNA2_/MRDRNA2_92849_c0_seq1.p1 gnl/MRDRNA2_/MRDRNA2_92849_c0~~gnl/MRDRNA2_/MRDRNA2_92849_c0_seq1.p1  ORF type:complete len:654 (+),score=125.25 gnl/MRDRNA2_/MRDRNA2_92849_c0_seq1:109-2070(+)
MNLTSPEAYSAANLMKAIPRAGERIIAAGPATNFLVTDELKRRQFNPVKPGSSRSQTPRRRPEWKDNHHVSRSMANTRLPSQQRSYFDGTPSFHVRCNAYQDLPQCPDCCNQMVWCDFGEGPYSSGWICNNVANCGSTAQNKGMWRWHCLQCSNDICGKCRSKNVHKQLMSQKLHALVDISQRSRSSMLLQNQHLKGSLANAQASASPYPATSLSPAQLDTVNEDPSKSPKALSGNASVRKAARHDSMLMKIDGQEEFIKYADWCKKKFGGLIQGWRALDGDANMVISKVEFFKALNNLGYVGDNNELWGILDRDDSNSLLFQHYCPAAAMQLAAFKEWAHIKFGDIEGLCRSWDTRRDGKLNMSEFRAGCKKHGLENEDMIDVVFEMYGETKRRGRQREITVDVLKTLEKWDVTEFFLTEPDHESFNKLKYELLQRHNGNALSAWRREIDRDGSMRLNYLEFHQLVKKFQNKKIVEEQFNTAGVWRAMDDNMSDWVSAKEFDNKAYQLVMDFKKTATARFGSCQKFLQQIEKQPVDLSTFQKNMWALGVCKNMSVKEDYEDEALARVSTKAADDFFVHEEFYEDSQQLFEGLDVDGSGALTAPDVRCVDLWDAEEDEAEENAWHSIVQIRKSLQKWVNDAKTSVRRASKDNS